MNRFLKLGVGIFCCWVVIFLLQKPCFLLVYQHNFSQLPSVLVHGMSLDLAMAGYLSIIPLLCLAIDGLLPDRVRKIVLRIYYVIASFAVAMSFLSNLVLYHYWRYPLDATPLFYFLSSPADAVASVSWWTLPLALCFVALLMTIICWIFHRLYFLTRVEGSPKFKDRGIIILLLGLLFIPIRGGFTVSSTNTGKAYFSDNQLLNHAAVNPLFSFFESVAHQEDFGRQYRFMDEKMARQLVNELNKPSRGMSDVSLLSAPAKLLRKEVQHPDIYLIIMESFSDTLLHVPGVTPSLNKLCKEGVYFSRFYANSFRTDRGLVSILRGFPSPASVSLMKFPKKTARMGSISKQLKEAGYDCHYYYGGDADFTNMRSFLINQGFTHITEDVDFPVTDRLSKWGVPDHLLFKKLESDLNISGSSENRGLTKHGDSCRMFRVIQTSSSHEPFDVPYHHLHDKRLNAFAYTDSCVGAFVKHLQADSLRWQRSLVIMVPDHLGAWPDYIDDFSSWRYHVPMIWVGGALQKPCEITTVGSQQDIAATLLGQLDIQPRNLPFSKNLLDSRQSHYAFFMMHDGEGMVTDTHTIIYDNQRRKTVFHEGKENDNLEKKLKAYVQYLFDAIATL